MTARNAIAGQLALMRRWQMIAPPELARDRPLHILLDLALCRYDHKRVQVTGVAPGMESATRLRWIGLLETEGWVSKVPDPFDRRRQWLKITDAGLAVIETLFASEMKAVA